MKNTDIIFFDNTDDYSKYNEAKQAVYESFRDKKGNRIFESRPMNFRSADGTYPEYWVKLFDSLGMDIPQGVPGTNPNDMSRSSRLQPLGWAPEQPVRR